MVMSFEFKEHILLSNILKVTQSYLDELLFPRLACSQKWSAHL